MHTRFILFSRFPGNLEDTSPIGYIYKKRPLQVNRSCSYMHVQAQSVVFSFQLAKSGSCGIRPSYGLVRITSTNSAAARLSRSRLANSLRLIQSYYVITFLPVPCHIFWSRHTIEETFGSDFWKFHVLLSFRNYSQYGGTKPLSDYYYIQHDFLHILYLWHSEWVRKIVLIIIYKSGIHESRRMPYTWNHCKATNIIIRG